jgi:hypothetical protein
MKNEFGYSLDISLDVKIKEGLVTNEINKIAIALVGANFLKISLSYQLTHFIKALSLQDFAFRLGSASTYCSKKYLFRRWDQ